MNRHSAHQIAETVMYAAEELRGYMNPDDPFPWELTEDDHLAILPRLRPLDLGHRRLHRGIARQQADERGSGSSPDSCPGWCRQRRRSGWPCRADARDDGPGSRAGAGRRSPPRWRPAVSRSP